MAKIFPCDVIEDVIPAQHKTLSGVHCSPFILDQWDLPTIMEQMLHLFKWWRDSSQPITTDVKRAKLTFTHTAGRSGKYTTPWIYRQYVTPSNPVSVFFAIISHSSDKACTWISVNITNLDALNSFWDIMLSWLNRLYIQYQPGKQKCFWFVKESSHPIAWVRGRCGKHSWPKTPTCCIT